MCPVALLNLPLASLLLPPGGWNDSLTQRELRLTRWTSIAACAYDRDKKDSYRRLEQERQQRQAKVRVPPPADVHSHACCSTRVQSGAAHRRQTGQRGSGVSGVGLPQEQGVAEELEF